MNTHSRKQNITIPDPMVKHLKYWDEALRVKKEEPTSLTVVNIKVESPSTPYLQYPPDPQCYNKQNTHCYKNQHKMDVKKLNVPTLEGPNWGEYVPKLQAAF